MIRELMLAAFIMAVGLCVAGAGTHLYQWLSRQTALLRYDGKTYLHAMGHLAMSFVCGPYIMLQLGWKQEAPGSLQMAPALLSAMIAFGWSFVTGLLFMGVYLAMLP